MGDTPGDFEALEGSVRELTELIAYQPDAIVSRTLIDADTTTVTAFAVAEGQRISEHSAPHDALVQVLDGTATIHIGEEIYTVGSGEGVAIPANEPHALEAESAFKMLLTMVR